MRIRLKARDVVAEGLPEEAGVVGATLTVAEGATPADVLSEFGLDVSQGFLVMIGDEVIVPSEVAKRRLIDGDLLTLLPPLKGG